MAELSASSVQGTRDTLEMEDNKAAHDVETTVVAGSSNASKAGDEGGANPDPLAHLPEHFRKEIEAQATVKTRKVTTKVLPQTRMI